MKSTRFASLAVAFVAIFTLVGCSTSTEPDAGQLAASESAAPEAAVCEDVTAPDDDIIPGEPVTDEFGTYCTVILDPASSLNTFEPDITDYSALDANPDNFSFDPASLESVGMSVEQVEVAYHTALDYAIAVVLDGTRLDNYSVPESDWFETVRPYFLDGAAAYDLTQPLTEIGITYTGYSPEPLVRDGNPRLTRLTINPVGDYPITALFNDEFGGAVAIPLAVEASYRATDADLVATFLERNPEYTEERLEAEAPQLFDGVDDGYTATGQFLTTARVVDPSLISGTRISLSLMAGDFDLAP